MMRSVFLEGVVGLDWEGLDAGIKEILLVG